MDEEEKQKEQDNSKDNTDKGIQSETTPLIERTEQTVEKLRIENDRKEQLLNRQEELISKQMLGGRSEGGMTVEEEKVTDEQYSDQVIMGEANPLADDGFI